MYRPRKADKSITTLCEYWTPLILPAATGEIDIRKETCA